MCASTSPTCGVNWRRPTCSESRCPRTSVAAVRGFVELALLLAEVGWSVAPVPVYATLLLGADTIARLRRRCTTAALSARRRRRLVVTHRGLAEPGRSDPTATGDHGSSATATAGDSTASRSWYPRLSSPRTIVIPASLDDDDVGVFLRRRGHRRGRDSTRRDDQRRTARRRVLDGAAATERLRPAAGRSSNRFMPAPLSVCARYNSASPSARCGWRRRTLPNANSSAGRSAASRPCNNGWPTPSSTSRRSGGPCGRPRGCSSRVVRRAVTPVSRNSGQPRRARGSRRPPSRCTGVSVSTPPIPCSVTSCGPSTTS